LPHTHAGSAVVEEFDAGRLQYVDDLGRRRRLATEWTVYGF
jgi:hypothetical protein